MYFIEKDDMEVLFSEISNSKKNDFIFFKEVKTKDGRIVYKN